MMQFFLLQYVWLVHGQLRYPAKKNVEEADWLRMRAPSAVYKSSVVSSENGLEISNGLIARKFVLEPAFGTVDYLIQEESQWRSMFREVSPEAVLLINGNQVEVGGLATRNTVRAYCNRTDFYDSLYAKPGLLYISHRILNSTKVSYPWEPGTRFSDPSLSWPPRGVRLEVDFGFGDKAQVVLAYEVYDGIPFLSKQLIVEDTSLNVSRLDLELIAVTPPFGAYLTSGSRIPGADDDGAAPSINQGPEPKLHAKTDQAYGTTCTWTAGNSTNNAGSVLPFLNCSGAFFPQDDTTTASFRTLTLVIDTNSNLQRQSLAWQRATEIIAPQTTEAPLFFHWAPLHQDDSFEALVPVIDQLADAGFEMIIFSFGSGFELESIANNATALKELQRKVAYAHSKNITDVGGYDLIVRDRGHGGYGGNAGDQYAVVDPSTGELTVDSCIASDWDNVLTQMIFNVINATNLSMVELDGPYGGAPCAATNHTYHTGLEDSVFAQTQKQNRIFHQLRAHGIYINSPDEYFYQGLNRASAGYSEKQYSLPVWQDITVSRQGMYDDLYDLSPTQGWMFVPLSVYEGGGEAAVFQDKPTAYEWALAQYLGAGVAACYRGRFLYNTSQPETAAAIDKALKKWIPFYKKHRLTLSKPIVHLRRADLQSYDGWLHVHPTSSTPEIGLALIFNPTEYNLTLNIRLPLYYTGVTGCCVTLTLDDHYPATFLLDSDYSVRIEFFSETLSIHTILVEQPHINHSQSENVNNDEVMKRLEPLIVSKTA